MALNYRTYVSLAVMASGLPFSQAVLAADASNDQDQLESIIVTAERRSVDPQKMAVSVVALSNEDLQEKGVKTIADLQALAPSLSYTDSGNVKFINIRGVGINEGAPNQTDGVANYLDGAYIAREFTTDDAYFDLESVEILRGPQGTYVGQNSTGGAIFVNTRKPTLSGNEGYARQTIGTFNYRSTEAAVNLPLTSTLAVRTAVLSESKDSFTTNFGPHGPGSFDTVADQPGNLNRFVGRVQLLYRPSDTLQFLLMYQNSSRKTDGIPNQPINATTWAHPWEASRDYPSKFDNKYQRTTGTVDWQISPGIKLHAVSSYQSMNQYTSGDGDGTSPFVNPGVAQNAFALPMHDWYSTHELDLLSSNDGPIEWTAGAATLNYHQPFTDLIMNNYGTAPDITKGLFLNFHTFRKNIAGFGEVGYQFSPKWQVKVGARYNHDQVGLDSGSYLTPGLGTTPTGVVLGGPNGAVKVPAGPNIQSFNATTGRLLVNYQATDSQLAYFTISRGYKPGGWTPNIGGGAPTATNVYGAETVTNYELGWKSTAMDNHLRTSVDVFHMDYEGFQATIATDPLNPATSVTRNVTGTKIQGLEAQLQALAGGVDFQLGFSLLDATFGNLSIFEPAGVFGPGNPAAPTLINLNGRQIDYAPKVSGNVSLAYEFHLGNGAKLKPMLQWTYQGGQYTAFFDAPQQYMPAYNLGTFRLSYEPSKSWRVEAYATNLTDHLYLSNTGGNTPALQNGTFGAPRQYGASLDYRF